MMSGPSYIPGDPWVICDLSGKQIRMSRSVKTWDGLRVDPDYWYPKHPQLFVKGVPDHMEVQDARPRPAEIFIYPITGTGPWTLGSSDGSIWTVVVSNAGGLVASKIAYQPTPPSLYLGGYEVTIGNTGVLSTAAATDSGPAVWIMISPNGTQFNITAPGGVLTVVAA